MTADVATWGAGVRALSEALDRLAPAGERIGVATPTGEEWHELLVHRLRPQCEAAAPVVAAVVGGTNIGKSAIFNQLAGEDASAVSPLAAGTKHPVALVPRGLDVGRLPGLFPGFALQNWHDATDALNATDADLLFWRASDAVPARLLLLDTPDVDSDARTNWRRADAVRQTADVLLAILTQQKYNDAAVKRFFRRAAEADKAVIVVFNQVDLALDREVWPEWLSVFCRETGVTPSAAYVVPHDRRGAQTRGLTFYDVGVDGRAFDPTTVDLRRELTELRYDEWKRRSLRGALARVVDPQTGVDRYLHALRLAADGFAAARSAVIEARSVGASWPTLPAAVLVEEIARWWDEHRGPWARRIHGFYRRVGASLARPIRRLFGASSEPADKTAVFCERERTVVVETVERLFGELERLARVGNEILRPRLERLLAGAERARALERIEAAHAALPPIDADFRAVLGAELERWVRENPRAASVLQSLDTVAAWSRPTVTVALAVTGVLLPAGGNLIGQTVMHVAGQTAGEIATAAALAGGGEAFVGAAGEGAMHVAAQMFRRLQTEHAESRAAALTRLFEAELLGELLRELEAGTHVADAEPFRTAATAVQELRAATRRSC